MRGERRQLEAESQTANFGREFVMGF